MSMKISHCINSKFGGTKHDRETDRTGPCNDAVNWSYYIALVAAEYGAFFEITLRGKKSK